MRQKTKYVYISCNASQQQQPRIKHHWIKSGKYAACCYISSTNHSAKWVNRLRVFLALFAQRSTNIVR